MQKIIKIAGLVFICALIFTSAASAQISITPNNSVNVFTDRVEFTIGYFGNVSTIQYKVLDQKNAVVLENSYARQSLMTINLPLSGYGNYTLEVYANEGDTASVPFTRIKGQAAVGGVRVVGMNNHFAQQKGILEINMDLMSKAGVSWIRDEYSWTSVEKSKGVYTFPAHLDNYVNAAKAKGMKVLLCLEYGNPMYDGGGAPYTEIGRLAYANYVKAVIEHLRGKVDAVEIWNEWSGNFGTGSIVGNSPMYYAELLKVVYPIVKQAAPEVLVVAGATHNEGTDWFKGMFEAGGYHYFDVLSYHPYNYPDDPETVSAKGSIEQNMLINSNLLKEYGGVKPIWLTEYGWPTGTNEAAVTESQQAAYMVRTYTMGMAYGIEGIFWYDFQNDGNTESDREHNFGIIRSTTANVPNSPKPSYIALAQFSSMLNGAEFVKEYRISKNTYCYRFYNATDQEDVVVLYNIHGTVDLTLSGGTAAMNVYDMYGNSIKPTSLSGEPIYLVGKNFSPSNITTSFRKAVKATLAINSLFDGIRGAYTGIAVNDGWPIRENGGFLSFDVTDSYMYGGVNQIEMSVRYLDSGNGSFKIEYDAASMRGKAETQEVELTNTGVMKTVKFIIDDARFANNLLEKDFRIVSTSEQTVIISEISVEKVVNKELSRVSAKLSDIAQFTNLTVWTSGQLNRERYEQIGDRTCWMTDIANGFDYLICDIDDSVLYDGSYAIVVNIEYFDKGVGKFRVQYGASNGNRFQNAGSTVSLRNTGTWKTARISISDAACLNNTNNGDFRIYITNEDVRFGSISVEHPQSTTAEKLIALYNPQTHEIEIAGLVNGTVSLTTDTKVGIQILRPGKTENDLIDFNTDNASLDFIYLGQINADKSGYFRQIFRQELSDGRYLVRVRMPGSQNVVTYCLNYFNSYEFSQITFTDRSLTPVNSLADLDYLQANITFLSGSANANVCIAMAVYNENNKMIAVNFSSEQTKAFVGNEIIVGVELNKNIINSNCTVKLFSLNNLNELRALCKEAATYGF